MLNNFFVSMLNSIFKILILQYHKMLVINAVQEAIMTGCLLFLMTRRTMDSTDAYNGGRAGDIFENRVNFE